MLQLTDTKLHQLHKQISQQFVYPEELAKTPDEEKARQLLDAVARCVSAISEAKIVNNTRTDMKKSTGADTTALTSDPVLQAALERYGANLASKLPRRLLNHIFSALCMLSDDESDQAELSVVCLFHILKQRMTPSLAELAWSFFQQHDTSPCMAQAFQVALNALLNKKQMANPVDYQVEKSVAYPVDYEMLPNFVKKLTDITKQTGIDSRLFETLAADNLENEAKWPLAEYLSAMQMLPGMPFTRKFLAVCFSKADDILINRDRDLYIYTLKVSSHETQTRLLNHYLRKDRLQDQWKILNLSLLKLYGAPKWQPKDHKPQPEVDGNKRESTHSDLTTRLKRQRGEVWTLTEPAATERFRVWEMLYRLYEHISFSHRKRLFYRKIYQHIRDIKRWDAQTLVLTFDHFYLADYSEDNDHVIYYDRNTYELMREQVGERSPIHRQYEKTPTARESILTGHQHHIVRLQLNSINLLYAIDFFENQQNQQQQSVH